MAKKIEPLPEKHRESTTMRVWSDTSRVLRIAADHRGMGIAELMHELAERELARLMPEIRRFLDDVERRMGE